MPTLCPATMCPLFAADGSPWTGHKRAPCPEREADPNQRGPQTDGGCIFWSDGQGCDGCGAAAQQVDEVVRTGATLQLIPSPRHTSRPRTFDCPHAATCSWQVHRDALCPPRQALADGIDPRHCAW